jgi:hypothetical protein
MSTEEKDQVKIRESEKSTGLSSTEEESKFNDIVENRKDVAEASMSKEQVPFVYPANPVFHYPGGYYTLHHCAYAAFPTYYYSSPAFISPDAVPGQPVIHAIRPDMRPAHMAPMPPYYDPSFYYNRPSAMAPMPPLEMRPVESQSSQLMPTVLAGRVSKGRLRWTSEMVHYSYFF